MTRAIRCPPCDREVSPEADPCPHCRYPIARGSMRRAGIGRAFDIGCLAVVVIGVALGLLAMCSRVMR